MLFISACPYIAFSLVFLSASRYLIFSKAYTLIAEPLARLDVTLGQFPEVCMCCPESSWPTNANNSIYAVNLQPNGGYKHPPMRWANGCACLRSDLINQMKTYARLVWVCRYSQKAALGVFSPVNQFQYQTWQDLAEFTDPARSATIRADLSYSSMEGDVSAFKKFRFIRTETSPGVQRLGGFDYQRFRGTDSDPGEAADPREWPTPSYDLDKVKGQSFEVDDRKVIEQGGSLWYLVIDWQPIMHRYIVLSHSSRAFLWLASIGGLFGTLGGVWTFLFVKKNPDHEIAKIYDERTCRPLIPGCCKKPAKPTESSADDGPITGILNSPEGEILGNPNDVQLRMQAANVIDASSNYEEHSQRGLKASE